MKDGWWINWRTGKTVAIAEHELDIRNPSVAKELGVPDEVFVKFRRYIPGRDRRKFLRWLMMARGAPLIRVRVHGEYVSFEYAAGRDALPMKAVRAWCRRYAGQVTCLRVVNLGTGKVRMGIAGTRLKLEPGPSPIGRRNGAVTTRIRLPFPLCSGGEREER